MVPAGGQRDAGRSAPVDDRGPSSRSGPVWRVGRKVGRTLYVDDKLVGMVDTPEIAAQIAAAMNNHGKCPCCGQWPCKCVPAED